MHQANQLLYCSIYYFEPATREVSHRLHKAETFINHKQFFYKLMQNIFKKLQLLQIDATITL